MKEIKTNRFKKRIADLITHPPVPGEKATRIKNKKKKKIYQLNQIVDDITVDDIR